MSVSGLKERTPVIHIGMPKTATKTLQWRLFAEHSEIYYLGRFDGAMFKEYREFDLGRNKFVQELMKQIAYDNIFNPDFTECRELLTKILEPAKPQNLLPVCSWESYSTDILAKRRVRARNLKKVFGDCKIIMCLRNPVHLLESAYFDVLKRENLRGLSSRPPLYYLSIDEWLEKAFHGEIMPHLQYAETIQVYVDQFGVDRVFVSLFENLIDNPEGFFRNICEVIGVDGNEGALLTANNKDNSRWTVAQIEALKRIGQSKLESLLFRFSGGKKRKQMLGLDSDEVPLSNGKKAKATIREEWQRRIYDITAEGDRWIEDVFHVPLRESWYLK